jgi:hypothetical protein
MTPRVYKKVRSLISRWSTSSALVFLFFAAFLLVGIMIFRDYGVAWDELYQREIGSASLNYIVKGDRALLTHKDRIFGLFFETMLAAAEKTIKHFSLDIKYVYFTRHALVFLIFYIGVFFFYRLCKYRFNSWKVGLLGASFLILSPRIFADAFYNSKDIPFLSMFIVSVYTLIMYLEKKTVFRVFFHALASAILIDIRFIGVLIVFLTIFSLVNDTVLIKPAKENIKETALTFPAYICFLVCFVLFFWPTLWENPIGNFKNCYNMLTHHGFLLPLRTQYMGKEINTWNLPWHYVPVWMLISIPPIYIISFFIGFFISSSRILIDRAQTYADKRNDLIFILWLAIPLAGIIKYRLLIYDAWRHMFFIYPAFLIFSLVGVTYAYDYLRARSNRAQYRAAYIALIIVVASSLTITARFMIRYHPFQNVYFNMSLGANGENIKHNFELDYWGLSYRQALEYIIKIDKGDYVSIHSANIPGELNAHTLDPKDRKRLSVHTGFPAAKYFIGDYRYRWKEYNYPKEREIYSINVNGAKIIAVYKLK